MGRGHTSPLGIWTHSCPAFGASVCPSSQVVLHQHVHHLSSVTTQVEWLNSRDIQGGSVMIASNIPPLLKGLAAISKVQRSSIRFATSYCLAERRMPGVFKTAMERQSPGGRCYQIDFHTFSSHLPAVDVGPKHKRTKVCRGLSCSAQ